MSYVWRLRSSGQSLLAWIGRKSWRRPKLFTRLYALGPDLGPWPIGLGTYGAPAPIIPLAALFRLSHHPIWRGLSFALLCVAWDLGWCDHDYPGGAGTTPRTVFDNSFVLASSASLIGSELSSLLGSGPSALPRPDALSPPVSLPLCGAHNTRWWEISVVAVLADRGGVIQLFDFLCRLA